MGSGCWNTLVYVCPELATGSLQHGEWGKKTEHTGKLAAVVQSWILHQALETKALSFTPSACVH